AWFHIRPAEKRNGPYRKNATESNSIRGVFIYSAGQNFSWFDANNRTMMGSHIKFSEARLPTAI
ncbi:hypothetical protein N9M41_07435, partial [Rhodopirellula sp.]|nr:hypothetical protein [Rhodopirellula sp.]